MPKKTKRKVKNTRKSRPTNNRESDNHNDDGASDTDYDVKVDYLDSPIKSEKDENEYRVLKLPNGIIALLVARATGDLDPGDALSVTATVADNNVKSNDTDQENPRTFHTPEWFDTIMAPACKITKTCCINLTIGTGYFSNPRQVPGVSELVSRYILNNAFLSGDKPIALCASQRVILDKADTTTMSIGVPEDHYLEAMDRLSNCLINPLMDRYTIDSAVYKLGTLGSTRCCFTKENGKGHLFANLASARHPAKALGPNYLKGLLGLPGDQVFKEVVKFRNRHYSAHRMTLVLKAPLPLETLEVYAKKYFSRIPNNRVPPRDLSQYNFANSFDTTKSRKIYTMNPTNDRDIYVLELNWTLPPSHWVYRSKPRDYLAWLIQHEGEGSLVSYLRKKNWCEKIIIGDNDTDLNENSIYCLFSMKIHLTQDGHNNHKKILDSVFSYINMLRRAGPQERIFDELRKIQDAKFRFEPNFGRVEFYQDLSVNMHLYPPIDYLTGRSLYLEYDHVSLNTCINLLTPERATVVVYDKNVTKDKTVPESVLVHYGNDSDDGNPKIVKSEIPEDWINHWKVVEPMPNFDLPKSNVFLPDDFTLIPKIKDPPRYPVKIYSDPLSEVWYKPDSTFRMPQCCMNFRYVTPLPLAEPENAAMLDLFVEALKQVMLEELYPAVTAEMQYVVEACENGLIVQAHGFSQKLPLLMQKISKYIAECPKLVTEDLFKKIKLEQEEKYRKSLRSCNKQCEELSLSIVRLVHWTSLDKQTALPSIKFHNLQHFLERFADHVYLQCLVQGNISEATVIESTRICVKLSNYRQLSTTTMPHLQVHEIPRGQHRCQVKTSYADSRGSTVKNYYQIGDMTSHRLAVMIDLLIMISTDSQFRELRIAKNFCEGFPVEKHTLGMLGYSLTGICLHPKIHHDSFAEITSSAHVQFFMRIDEKIENYRKQLNVLVKSFSETELLHMKIVLLAIKLQPDASLQDEVSRNWREITSGDYIFNRLEQEVAAIEALGPDDMRKWLAHLTTNASKLRKLSVQVYSGEEFAQYSMDRKIKQDKNNCKPDGKNNQQHGLTYLIDLPKDKEEKCHYCITNIEDFKIGLKVLPVVRKIAATTAASEPSTTASTTKVTKSNQDFGF